MYRLVAIDLDGTLLDKNKEISERNKIAIHMAKEKGVKIVICSGRVYSGARIYAKQLGIMDPIIACNGAIIRENADGKVIYSNYMHTDDCLKILDIFHENSIYFHVYAGETMLTERLDYNSLKYYERNKALHAKDRVEIDIVTDMEKRLKELDGKVLKLVAVSDDSELLATVRKKLSIVETVDVTSSNYNNFEVVNKGVNKGKALERLSNMLKIPYREIIAIGDNENDIPMFDFAGLGVAMGNGEDCAKEAADYITATNTEDGVAKAIEKFILG
ncbi:Cof-type HAD-IIB family hydrolase [Ruminiclostridium cellulolyticum]|uniref:Cof-like hydrolase n=1 Tax=Ruminiclostridium cellulolyticum (strain ATCC 35319 / DSM 5812 / JCM 6584 / H10) TaxID=394503 RepID=B8I4P5_RUMCH|nr:Cof-type HAD-IIB family hydrolase [Ruminiclostridium cellulolyticum]ACL76549.1 Cof-like hydrolase [Ruminiclostridium cellulolyticum H10]